MSHVAQGKQQKKLFVLIQEATNLTSLVCALYRQVVEVIAAHRGIADIGGFARTLYENTCRLASLVLCEYSDVSSIKLCASPRPVVEKIEVIVCKVKQKVFMFKVALHVAFFLFYRVFFPNDIDTLAGAVISDHYAREEL